jgi:biotin transport system substrate-specific component
MLKPVDVAVAFMAESYGGVDLVSEDAIERLATAVLLAALTAVLAQASIQLPGGIPFSFQPFGVFFAGLLLGPVWGGFALLVYILAGIAGAPVFSNLGAGIGYLAGPTGGFLVGFLIGAVVIGGVAHRRRRPRSLADVGVSLTALALVAGLVPIYAVGVPWFASVQGWSIARAGAFLAPFLLGDLLKVAITVGIVRGGADLTAR